MWKDFFYFSKSERRAILFLLTLLFIFMCIWVLFPVKYKPQNKMFRFYKTFCSRITLINTNQNVILNPI